MTKLPYNILRQRIIKKDDSDPKRDKRHCIYYEDGYCHKQVDNCYGSSFCTLYKAYNSVSKKENKSEIIDKVPFKQIINCYSRNSRSDMKYDNYTVVIKVNKKTYFDIINELRQKGKITINLWLKNPTMWNYFDKIFITQIFVRYDENLFQCYTNRDDIYGLYNDDKIRIHFRLYGLIENRTFSKHAKLITENIDQQYGKVIFYKNRVSKYYSKK